MLGCRLAAIPGHWSLASQAHASADRNAASAELSKATRSMPKSYAAAASKVQSKSVSNVTSGL